MGKGRLRGRRVTRRPVAAFLPRGAQMVGLMALAVFIAVLALGLTYGAGRAKGEENNGSSDALAPTAQQTKEFLESGRAGALLEESETNLHAAQTLPHRNLERGEALELAEAVFETEIESAGGIYDELEPEKFLSNYAAVVPVSSLPEDSPQPSEGLAAERPNMPVLVESVLPLRTEDASGEERAVDLELERSEGELQPQNPLAEVGIPQQLGEGISLLGPEVAVTVAGAPEGRSATDAGGDFAFYPEVAKDSDLIVTPTPRGVETMVDIRSADAPMQTVYDLALPANAELQTSNEGGAEVVEDGQTTLYIPPPSAVDAAGNPVETELNVSAESITVAVSPNPSTIYPILVDPTYVTEGWRWTLNHDSMAAWNGTSTNWYAMEPIGYEIWNPTYYPGLDLTSAPWGGTSTVGTQANWEYWVPRYREDLSNFGSAPSSYVYEMFTEGVLFLPYGNTANYPALVLGLVDPAHGWQTAEVHYGGQGEMNNWSNWFRLRNENSNHENDTNDKGADMNLVTYEVEAPPKRRDTYMADAYISVVDTDAPKIPRLVPPEHWMNSTPEPIEFESEDMGLGVKYARIGFNGATEPGWGFEMPCSSTAISPCPRRVKSNAAGPGEAQASLYYAPSALPTGKDALSVVFGDIMWGLGVEGHTYGQVAVVKIDHTAPEVSLSGPLTEQGALGTHRPSYPLRISAKDGVEGAPQSGIKKVEVLIDGKKVAMPEETEWEPNCQTQNCPFSGEWSMGAAEYSAGTHEVKVIATDAVGNTTTKVLQVELHPVPPTLSLSSTLTEQATLGTERPSYTLKTTASALMESPSPATLPTYSSSFGSAGTGNGQLSHPADVAIGPEGNLFVVDTQNNRIEKFNEKGEYLAQFGTKGSGNGQLNRPTAVAFAANGNLWVTDAGNKRVEEFTPTGTFVAKFGEAGTGPGQFAGSGPEGVAIDFHGNIWVSDTYGARLEKFSENGTFIRAVSSRGEGVGQLLEPTGIEIGPGGNVFVTDWGNDKVAEFGEGGTFIRQFGSKGTEAGALEGPTGIAIDSAGNVWVGDERNERVEEFNQGGEYLRSFGTAGSGAGQFSLGYPDGIATDGKGDIWVADSKNNRVEKWVSGNYAAGSAPTFTAAFATKASPTGRPTGIAIDAKGSLWTTDFANDTLQKYSPQGEFLASYGSQGQGAGQFYFPIGLTINSGHIWVADTLNNRIEEFNESGAYLGQFGSAGTGAGQFNNPEAVAVDSNHHIWVPDSNNNRVEEFTEAGGYIKSIGTTGAGKLNGPGDVAIGPGNTIFVADYHDNRVVEFNEAGTFIRQIGGATAEIGQLNQPSGVYVESKSEQLWVTEGGNNRVKGYTITGEYLGQFGTTGSGSGQLNAPIYIAGDESGHLFIADMNNSRISEWTEPAVHSQISTEITLDGRRKEAYETSCAAKTCSASHEWTLSSSSLSPGSHEVKVTATDGLGDTTTKSMSIKVGDATKPTLEVGGELATAPEGWIEQEEGNYAIHATATDGGYGVTSLVFSLDGKAIASKTQSCPAGACSAAFSTIVNAQELAAGSHPAEVVATDGAGNTTTKKWTVNVDPEGEISTGEAEATFEALETTAPVNLIGESTEEEIEGTVSGLGVEEADGELQGTGGAVPIALSNESGGEIQMEVAGAQAFWPVCEEPVEPAESEEPEEESTESSECLPRALAEVRAEQEEEEVARGEKTPGHEPITIRPVGVSDEGSSVAAGVAAITPNTNAAVDTVTRPLADGGVNFEDIRSSYAPEHYAFEIEPYGSELELRQVSPQVITAFYKEGGYSAFTLEAEPARDADGHTVPTHLTLNNQLLVTLTVEHRGIAAGTGEPFVYPVVAGTGWEGGWFYGVVEKYAPEEETNETEDEEESISERGSSVTIMASGPPELMPSSSDAWQIEPLISAPFERRFKFTYCVPKHIPGNPAPPGSFEGLNRQISPETSECHREDFEGVRWATTVHGHYEYKAHQWVRVQAGRVECGGWGEQYPKKEHCKVIGVGVTSGPADVVGEYRFPAGRGEWQWVAKPTCFIFGGKIYPREAPSGGGVAYERPPVWFREPLTYPPESCDWSSYEKSALQH